MRNEGPRRDLFCVQLVIFGLISRRGARRGTEEGRKNIRSGVESSGGRGGGGGREDGGREREDGKSGECREGTRVRSRVYKL